MYMRISILAAAALVSTGAFAQGTIGPNDAFQVRYASNLNKGDSYVNITNTGSAHEEAMDGEGFGAGNICVNVYTFDPSEEMVSCCACLVTPNALVSLSVQGDLISNTLSPSTPTAVVIKLVASSTIGATAGTSGTQCNAAEIESTPAGPSGLYLVPGMRAWGTTLHALPGTPTTYGLTESRFVDGGLSIAELEHLTSFCGFINSNGSGFGICKSCRTGGLGGAKQ
jgi:hypothetical protein